MARQDNRFDYQDGVSLRDFLCNKISNLDQKMELTFKLNQSAIDKAESSMNARLESMNEFRDTLRDQNKTFITKSEHEYLEKQIVDLQLSKAELAGKATQSSVNISYIIAISSILISVVSLIVIFFK